MNNTTAGKRPPGTATRPLLILALLLGSTVAPPAGAAGRNSIKGTIPEGLTVRPVFSALWLSGKDPKESAGGPFVYLFSSTREITCADAAKGKFPAETLLMEIVIGAKKASNRALKAHSDPPGAGFVYAAWLKTDGGFNKETPAVQGRVILNDYSAGKSVSGTFQLANPKKKGVGKHSEFDVTGSFHATWCDHPSEI